MMEQQSLLLPETPGPIVLAGAGAPISSKPVFVGKVDGKDYFLDVDPRSPTYNQVIWQVPDIRDGVTAEPGKKIVGCDYSQIEIRIMTALSKDPWLMAAVNSKKDMHCFMATDVFGEEDGFDYDTIAAATKGEFAKSHPRHKELNDRRDGIKKTSFGIPYGVSPIGLSYLIGKDEAYAKMLINRFFDKAKVLKTWLENQGDFAVQYGYTATLSGRKRFYTIPNPEDPRAEEMIKQIRRWSGNHPIQGSNADMLKMALRYLYLALRDGKLTGPAKWGARILFVVHDEIVATCDEQYAHLLKTLIEEAMDWAYEKLIGSAFVYHKSKACVADAWAKA
jgi:DNA polymerase-1